MTNKEHMRWSSDFVLIVKGWRQGWEAFNLFRSSHLNKLTNLKNYLWLCILFILTPRTFFPSFSMEQGHQPLTDCWANRDLACSLFCGVPISRSSIIVREHFSGVFAGGTRLRKSSSSTPGMTRCYTAMVRFWNHVAMVRCDSKWHVLPR